MSASRSTWERFASGASIALLFAGVLVAERGGDFKWAGSALAVLAIAVTGAMLYKMENQTGRDTCLRGTAPRPAAGTSEPITRSLGQPHRLADLILSNVPAPEDLLAGDIILKKLGGKDAVLVFLEPAGRELLISVSESGYMSVSVRRLTPDLESPWELGETSHGKDRWTESKAAVCYV